MWNRVGINLFNFNPSGSLSVNQMKQCRRHWSLELDGVVVFPVDQLDLLRDPGLRRRRRAHPPRISRSAAQGMKWRKAWKGRTDGQSALRKLGIGAAFEHLSFSSVSLGHSSLSRIIIYRALTHIWHVLQCITQNFDMTFSHLLLIYSSFIFHGSSAPLSFRQNGN